MQPKPYVSIRELSQLTPWSELAIRTMMSRETLKLNVHYFMVRRRCLFKWAAVVGFIEGKDFVEIPDEQIPLSKGGFLGES